MFRKDIFMKVNSHKDSVNLSQVARSKQPDAAAAAKLNAQQGAEPASETKAVGSTASVNISGEAKALAAANQLARSDNTDQAKIDRIKAMINSGSYQPDFGKVADRMINETLLQETS
jgi:flagellar biosynthesis anti-sigma factor FlgM